MKSGYIFYVLSWISDDVKHTVRSIPAAYVSAAAEDIDNEKAVRNECSAIFGAKANLSDCVDSKDFFSSFLTQKLLVGRLVEMWVLFDTSSRLVLIPEFRGHR